MIEVQDLHRKPVGEMLNLLLDQKKQSFDIFIPKSTQLFRSERQAVARDYANLAYCGQLLNDCSVSFDYEQIQPQLHESVLFRIKTERIEELAQTIFQITFGYINDIEDDFFDESEVFDFEGNANQFLLDVEEGIKEPVCNYFYQTFLEFSKS